MRKFYKRWEEHCHIPKLGLPLPHSMPTTQVLPVSSPLPSEHHPSASLLPLLEVPGSVCLTPPPSLLPQGVVRRADQSFATARNRGRPRCPSSPSCSSTTSQSSWPRPGPSTAFPSSTASLVAAVRSSLPRWLPPLLKSQP